MFDSKKNISRQTKVLTTLATRSFFWLQDAATQKTRWKPANESCAGAQEGLLLIPFHKGPQLQFKRGSLLHLVCATIEPKRMVVWKMMPWTLPRLSSHVSFRRCLSYNSRMRYDKLYPKKKLRWTGMASCGVYSFKSPQPNRPTQTARAN